MNDDGVWHCSDPAACDVCRLWPKPGETRQAFLARVGEMYRAAPERKPPTVPPAAESTCPICGAVFSSVRALVCSQRCRNIKSGRNRRGRRWQHDH